MLQENKAGQIFRKTNISFPQENEHLLPPDAHVGIFRGKNCSFFGKFDLLCFLVTPVLRFDLLPYHRRI